MNCLKVPFYQHAPPAGSSRAATGSGGAGGGPREPDRAPGGLELDFRLSVLGCIDSYDSENRRIFQLFSRSTRFPFLCTAQISKFQQNAVQLFAKLKNEYSIFLRWFNFISRFFCEISMKFCRNFTTNFRK